MKNNKPRKAKPACSCAWPPNITMPNEDCPLHGSTTPARRLTKASGRQPFPDRVVLGEGFPWATGLGKPDRPYDSAMVLASNQGVNPNPLNFPHELWAKDVPRYRLVLERIRPDPNLRCRSPFSLCLDCQHHNSCKRYANHRRRQASKTAKDTQGFSILRGATLETFGP